MQAERDALEAQAAEAQQIRQELKQRLQEVDSRMGEEGQASQQLRGEAAGLREQLEQARAATASSEERSAELEAAVAELRVSAWRARCAF